jgi:predicted small metal-binding protein
MARKFIDCRDYPDGTNCTVAISADNEDELIEAVVQHSVAAHGHEDTPEFRELVRSGIKEGAPA